MLPSANKLTVLATGGETDLQQEMFTCSWGSIQTCVVIGGAGARKHCELIVRHVQMLQRRPVRLCVFVCVRVMCTYMRGGGSNRGHHAAGQAVRGLV